MSYTKKVKFENGILHSDVHFKTNFSIEQKEDTEDTEFDNQQAFQMIPFEKKFDAVDQTKAFLHNIDTILIPADSHEITYTGAWSDSDSASYKFGRGILSSTAGNYCEFGFSGVSCFMAVRNDDGSAQCYSEISDDGGSTWKNKKDFTTEQTFTGANFNTVYDLYTGLEYGDYKIRITVGSKVSADSLDICYVGYTTYINQRPSNQYYSQLTAVKNINQVPPITTLLTGTWNTINAQNINMWNSNQNWSNNADAIAEFKFYGSKIWICTQWATDVNTRTVDVLIDSVTTYNKQNTIFKDTPNNTLSVWIRLDNGNLSEGWHTVNLSASGTAGVFYISGWGYYSASAVSTVCRSLICGKESYAVGVDDSVFTFNGTWIGIGDSIQSFLRRENQTVVTGSSVQITTPNNSNLKAIYLIGKMHNSVAGSIFKATLGGDTTDERWLDQATNNYGQGSQIFLLYDKTTDGDLHNKVLKIFKDEANSEAFRIEGIIFEIGDPVEDDNVWCMPKWTRYNDSVNWNTCVSTAHRLDVYGNSIDKGDERKPSVHSGWVWAATSGNIYYRNGLGLSMKEYSINIAYAVTNPSFYSERGFLNRVGTYSRNDPGIIIVEASAFGTAGWYRTSFFPNRVI